MYEQSLKKKIVLVRDEIARYLKAEKPKNGIIKPIKAPVLAEDHTPIYKMHRYFARRPHNVFAYIIKHYTNPGDIILDPFCGGGVTVAACIEGQCKVLIDTCLTEEKESEEEQKCRRQAYDWFLDCIRYKTIPLPPIPYFICRGLADELFPYE